MKPIIKLKFVDFFSSFDKTNNEFLDVLREQYEVIQTDNPDYIIYSVFGYEHLHYDCIRIFYTGECITPDFNECDYAIGFDRLQFGDRYVRIPLYNLFQYKTAYQKLINRPVFSREELRSKKGFCNFVYSNCFAQDLRTEIFEKLSQYKQVDSGGRYRNNIGGAVVDKYAFQSLYKFSIAFENASYDGYVTEKIMEAFAARTIPIYYGDPRIAEDFNPKAFINVHDYASLDDVIKQIEIIDQNEDLYLTIINEPVVNPNLKLDSLHDFLSHIVEQPLSNCARRPHSIPSKAQEAMKLRHEFYETYIYQNYRKLQNQIIRARRGTLLSRKRTK